MAELARWLREEILDELAPTRHNESKAKVIGRVRKTGMLAADPDESSLDGNPIYEGGLHDRIALEAEREDRFKLDAIRMATLYGDVTGHMAEHFPGVELDPELMTYALERLTRSSKHSLEVAMRVLAKPYAFAVREKLLALQDRGIPITTRNKALVTAAFALVYPGESPEWYAAQLAALGVTPLFVDAVLRGRTCEVCGKPILGRRADAKTCSDACRTQKSRARRKPQKTA
jgi:predicted nucleic acid-binding Zn ribbon protein